MEIQNDKVEIEEVFHKLAEIWESTHIDNQLTHIKNALEVKTLILLGKKALPLMAEKLKSNRLWYIPMEGIIRNESDDDLTVEEVEGKPEEISGGRFTHLEGHRQAVLEWMEKNKEKFT